MELTAQERRDLGAFFAKRFPDPSTRARLASGLSLSWEEPGGTSPLAAWTALLSDLEAAGRLEAFALAAAREDVHDENLQQVCGVLAGDRPAWVRRLATPRIVGIAGAAAAAVGLFGVAAFQGADVTPVAHAEAVRSAPPPPAVTEAPPAAAEAAPVAASIAETDADPAPEGDGAEPEVRETAGSASAAPQLVQPAHANGRCTVRDGGLVGYWYAGRARPGAQGETITVTSAVRVRADYPDAHNQFDARAPIRCHLAPGDRVTLSAAPLHVPGDAWWVPLHSGDLAAE